MVRHLKKKFPWSFDVSMSLHMTRSLYDYTRAVILWTGLTHLHHKLQQFLSVSSLSKTGTSRDYNHNAGISATYSVISLGEIRFLLSAGCQFLINGRLQYVTTYWFHWNCLSPCYKFMYETILFKTLSGVHSASTSEHHRMAPLTVVYTVPLNLLISSDHLITQYLFNPLLQAADSTHGWSFVCNNLDTDLATIIWLASQSCCKTWLQIILTSFDKNMQCRWLWLPSIMLDFWLIAEPKASRSWVDLFIYHRYSKVF